MKGVGEWRKGAGKWRKGVSEWRKGVGEWRKGVGYNNSLLMLHGFTLLYEIIFSPFASPTHRSPPLPLHLRSPFILRCYCFTCTVDYKISRILSLFFHYSEDLTLRLGNVSNKIILGHHLIIGLSQVGAPLIQGGGRCG